jgi:hypothetical protein
MRLEEETTLETEDETEDPPPALAPEIESDHHSIPKAPVGLAEAAARGQGLDQVEAAAALGPAGAGATRSRRSSSGSRSRSTDIVKRCEKKPKSGGGKGDDKGGDDK